MNLAILTRYPRVDTALWKQELAARLLTLGRHLTVIYTRSALSDQVRAGLGEFGFGVWERYRRARQASQDEAPARTLTRWAEDHGVGVLRFGRIDERGLAGALTERRIDLLVLAGADIVPPAVLAIPKVATINAHFALLPRYRGMNVAEWSIYHDDPVGVSVHVVDPGIDTGDVVSTRGVPVVRGDTLETLRVQQRRVGVDLLGRAVEAAGAGRMPRSPQDAAAGRQFYRMHPVLRGHVVQKLASGSYLWTDRLPSS